MQETLRDPGSNPELGRSSGGEPCNPLQYSCLENPMDKRAWQTTVCRVAKSQIQLMQLNVPSPILLVIYCCLANLNKPNSLKQNTVSHSF